MPEHSERDKEGDEQKDKFIRGVLICQVWAEVVSEHPGDIAVLARIDEEISPEYEKLINGETHEFDLRMADHFGLAYNHTKDGIKLLSPYGKRYEKAWVDLGAEPSLVKKISNIVTSRRYF